MTSDLSIIRTALRTDRPSVRPSIREDTSDDEGTTDTEGKILRTDLTSQIKNMDDVFRSNSFSLRFGSVCTVFTDVTSCTQNITNQTQFCYLMDEIQNHHQSSPL